MTAEQFPAAITAAGWRLYHTTDGRLRVCTYPPVHPATALTDSPDVYSLAIEALIAGPDDRRVALVACNVPADPVRLQRAELPPRLWPRAAAVRADLERLAE